MRRPSFYVLLTGGAVLLLFAASGHLQVGGPAPQPAKPVTNVRLQPPARSKPTDEVVGCVWDSMGFVLIGAEVGDAEAKDRTDADGRFRLDLPKVGVADLAVAARGYRTSWLRVFPGLRESLVIALEPAAPWDQPPPPPPQLLQELVGEGYVRGEGGAAVANALVWVIETGAEARTNEVGHYAIPVPTDGATLLVQAPESEPAGNGRAARSEKLTFNRQRGAVLLPELVVAKAAALRGTVRDERGQPLAGVPIQVVGNGLARMLVSSDGGAFRLAGLLPGAYQVRSFAYRGALGASSSVTIAAAVADCELHLRPASERRVQVVTEAGAPVARAMVATSVAGLRRGVHRADSEGWVQVRAAAADAVYDVRTADDYQPLRVVAAPTGDAGRLVVALP
jgi:hypothetical protein